MDRQFRPGSPGLIYTVFGMTLLCWLMIGGCFVEDMSPPPEWTCLHGNVTPYPCPQRSVGFDPLRQRLMVCGGTKLPDLWEYDGNRWSESIIEDGPILSSPAVCFHAGLGMTMYFGGWGESGFSHSLWAWDGQNWLDMTPASSPNYRYGAAMVYDSDRDCLVLFGGGISISNPRRDTWEWHAGEWRMIKPVNRPPGRMYHTMTYDAKNRRTILFGGRVNGFQNDTWSYDGQDWTQLGSSTKPARRQHCSLIIDRETECPLLFGGQLTDNTFCHDLWRLEGNEWQLVTDLAGEETRLAYPALWQDASGVLRVFCSDLNYQGSKYAVVFRIEGNVLSEEKPAEVPIPGWSGVMTHDLAGNRIIYISPSDRNGPDATWQFRDGSWRNLAIDLPSGGEFTLKEADTFFCDYDRRAGKVLLVPPQDGFETDRFVMFELGGDRWRRRELQGRPRATARFAHAYDVDRGVLVIYGGSYEDFYTGHLLATDETWEYDGQSLRRILPSSSPSPRFNARMAYDSERGRCILFGGNVVGPEGYEMTYRETWEYTDRVWRRIETVNAPLKAGPMVWYPRMRRIILCESLTRQERYLRGIREPMTFWTFDGFEWQPMPELDRIPTRYNPALTADPDGDALYLLGGEAGNVNGTAALSDFWTLS